MMKAVDATDIDLGERVNLFVEINPKKVLLLINLRR
jgi:hypothetical protein